MIRVEVREQRDGTWDIHQATDVCDALCVDVGPGVMHHPDCGWELCADAPSRAAAEKKITAHYGPVGVACEFIDYVPDAACELLEDL